MKYINDEVICYLNIPKNIRTVNSIEIFNRYFHKKCNGKGLVTIYELLDSIKEEFKENEFKLFNYKKKLSNNATTKNKKSRNKIKHNNYIEKESTNDIQNFIKNSLNEILIINDDEEEGFDYKKEKETKDTKFDFKIYNNKSMFKYLNRIYIIYDKNSCWIDCFIILYIFVYKINIIKLIDNNNEYNNINQIISLNDFTQYIFQSDRAIPLKFFNLYEKISQNYNNNFLFFDKNIIGSFN